MTKSELQNINQTGVHFQGHDQVEGHQIIETEVTTTAPVQVCWLFSTLGKSIGNLKKLQPYNLNFTHLAVLIYLLKLPNGYTSWSK